MGDPICLDNYSQWSVAPRFGRRASRLTLTKRASGHLLYSREADMSADSENDNLISCFGRRWSPASPAWDEAKIGESHLTSTREAGRLDPSVGKSV